MSAWYDPKKIGDTIAPLDWDAMVLDILTRPRIQPYSYLIYTDGTYTYSQNGNTGYITYNTDASTVIQSAINSLPNGGKIFIKNGTYNFLLDQYIIPKNNTYIQGEGNSTIFKLYGNSTKGSGIYISNVQNVRISDIQIDGYNQVGGVYTPNIGTTIGNNSKNVSIDNIYSDTQGFGIFVSASDNVRITNSNLIGHGNNDIIGGGSSYGTVSNVLVENNYIGHYVDTTHKYDNACDIVGVYRIALRNNYIYGHLVFGTEVWPNSYSSISGNFIKPAFGSTAKSGVSIYNNSSSDIGTQINILDNNIEDGYIRLSSVNGMNITSSNIVNNTIKGQGIYLDHIYESTISNNTMINGTIYTNKCLGNIFSANTITDSNIGIDEGLNSNENMFINNIFTNVITPFKNIGPNTITTPNIIRTKPTSPIPPSGGTQLDLSTFTKNCGGFGPSSYINSTAIYLVSNEFGNGYVCAFSPLYQWTTSNKVVIESDNFPKAQVYGITSLTGGNDNAEPLGNNLYIINLLQNGDGRIYLYGNYWNQPPMKYTKVIVI